MPFQPAQPAPYPNERFSANASRKLERIVTDSVALAELEALGVAPMVRSAGNVQHIRRSA